MIWFLDCEHPSLAETAPAVWASVARRRLETKYRLEELTGEACLLVRLGQLSRVRATLPVPRAILTSGNNTAFDAYPAAHLEALRGLLRDPPCPLLAICGSFQQLVVAHGGSIGPMPPLATGEDRARDAILPADRRHEHGFCGVEPTLPTPLWEGLPVPFTVWQHHFWEVQTVPPALAVTARSDACAVQAVAHRERPVWGVQFHPEEADAVHPDGWTILANFWHACA